MGMERHGTGETWDWRNMGLEKRWTRETDTRSRRNRWDRRNVGQKKRSTGETGYRRNVGQENHRTRETRHWVQEKHGTGQRGSEETDDRKKNMGLEKRRTGKTYGTGETWNTCERGCTIILEKA